MQKNFFKGLSLERIVTLIEGLAFHDLFPSREVFIRLRELEEGGEKGVETSISHIFDGAVLREYRKFKDPSDLAQQNREAMRPEGTIAQHDFVFSVQMPFFSEEKLPFERIRTLHRQYVPVFTMMHAAGYASLANAYRRWLFAQYPQSSAYTH